MPNYSPEQKIFNFLPITIKNLFKFSAQGSDLVPFIANETKAKVPSDIKPPLVHYKFLTVSPTPGGMKFLLSRYFLTFLQFHQEQELMNKEIRK